MKNVLLVIGFIMLLGLVGRMECQDNMRMAQIDQENKQEVIKDLELKCYNGTIDPEYCNGVLK